VIRSRLLFDANCEGYTKDSMKLVQAYRATERYAQSANTAAIVNAKYQSVPSAFVYVYLIRDEIELLSVDFFLFSLILPFLSRASGRRAEV